MSKRRDRDERKLREDEVKPERAAKISQRKGVKDAFCTECKTWYDSSSNAEVDRHAH